MRHNYERLPQIQNSEYWTSLLMLAAFFISGAVAGCYFASDAATEGVKILSVYIKDFVASAEAASSFHFFNVLASVVKFPFLAFLCGFIFLGYYALPAIFAVRGFLLSFAITAFFRLYGNDGLALSAVFLGISCLISVPCFFMLGVYSSVLSKQLFGNEMLSKYEKQIMKKKFLLFAFVCLCILVIGSLAEVMISSKLFGLIANYIK